MGMKSVFSELSSSFCTYFRLLSLYCCGMRIFIWTVGKLQKFVGFRGCGCVFLNTQKRNCSQLLPVVLDTLFEVHGEETDECHRGNLGATKNCQLNLMFQLAHLTHTLLPHNWIALWSHHATSSVVQQSFFLVRKHAQLPHNSTFDQTGSPSFQAQHDLTKEVLTFLRKLFHLAFFFFISGFDIISFTSA